MTQTTSSGVTAGAAATEQTGHATGKLPLLILGALGVVFGDIGTSPLYAFREALHASGGSPNENEVLGLLSLIVWALTIVVTVKYVIFVLRADNKGEGGTLSLMTLASNAFKKRPAWILGLGIVGGALFLGDAIITRRFRCSRQWKAWRSLNPA